MIYRAESLPKAKTQSWRPSQLFGASLRSFSAGDSETLALDSLISRMRILKYLCHKILVKSCEMIHVKGIAQCLVQSKHSGKLHSQVRVVEK